jgi:transcriptional regulator with XRE-family HTH domain
VDPASDARVAASGPRERAAALVTPALDELGRRIRKVRIERRMTLKQVEAGSGLSATHLSEIERGRTSPTIGALIRIARSLGREPAFFLETAELKDIAHQRRENLESIRLSPGVTIQCLSPGIPGSELHAYRVRLASGTGTEWRPVAKPASGEALFLVTRGCVEVTIGDGRVTLHAGDAARSSLALPHGLRPGPGESPELLAVLTRALEDTAG